MPCSINLDSRPWRAAPDRASTRQHSPRVLCHVPALYLQVDHPRVLSKPSQLHLHIPTSTHLTHITSFRPSKFAGVRTTFHLFDTLAPIVTLYYLALTSPWFLFCPLQRSVRRKPSDLPSTSIQPHSTKRLLRGPLYNTQPDNNSRK